MVSVSLLYDDLACLLAAICQGLHDDVDTIL